MSEPGNRLMPTAEYLAEEIKVGPRVGMIVSTVASLVIICLRFYTRIYVVKRLGLDDFLMGICLVFSVAVMALCLALLDLGCGTHIKSIPPDRLVELTKHLVAVQLVYHIALWFCRISGLAFYARICEGVKKFRAYLWVASAFVTAVALTQALILGLQCIPLDALWKNRPGRCMSQFAVFIATATMTIICDSLVLLIPLRIIWNLQIGRRQKVAIGVLLLIGVLAVVISVFRILSMVPAVTEGDPTWHHATILAWSCAEVNSAMIALSIPALKPLFGKFVECTAPGTKAYKEFGTPRSRSAGRNQSCALDPIEASEQSSHIGHTSEEDLFVEPFNSHGISKTVDVRVTHTEREQGITPPSFPNRLHLSHL